MDKEIRVMKTNFEVKNDKEKDKRKVVGYAALFDDPADENMGFIEKISPGAFDKALKKSDTRALINHNPEKILGRVKSGTLKLKEDKKGLFYEVDPPETTYAKDLMESMSRGDIDQSSFGFTVSVEKWDDSGDIPVRTIVEVDELFDISPVTYPWYENTESGIKNREKVFEEYKADHQEKENKHNEVLNKIVEMEIKHKID